MKTLHESLHKQGAQAAQERPVGKGAKNLDQKQKKILNLEEEAKHQTGKERLATDEATRDVDRGR